MNFTCIFFGILFIATGILFAAGKLHKHIAAWKNMPVVEKCRIRIVPLCRNIGFIISLSGIIFMVNGFWQRFRDRLFVISMIVWLVLAGIDVFMIEKKHWYEINTLAGNNLLCMEDKEGKDEKKGESAWNQAGTGSK